MTDFNDGILAETGHRPWPMPSRAVGDDTDVERPAVCPLAGGRMRPCARWCPRPSSSISSTGRRGWAVVPFHMTNVTPRFVPPLPWVSAFPELNVRTYVRAGDKPGVYFFSLDAGNPVAVGAARTLLNLPYYTAEMTVTPGADEIQYRCRRRRNRRRSSSRVYRGLGDRQRPAAGHARILPDGAILPLRRQPSSRRLPPRHPSSAVGARIRRPREISINTMADAAGIRLPSIAPLLHFARRQDMVCWAPETVKLSAQCSGLRCIVRW